MHRDATRENVDAFDGTWSNGVAATVIETTARYGKLNRDMNAFDNGLTRSIEHEGTFHRTPITIRQMAALAQSARVIGTTVRRTLSDWGITVLLSSRTWSRPCRRRPGASRAGAAHPAGIGP
ncbi:hypothetical protein [Pseudonocardia acidicola]|uniref:Uncharacterized protein n=1 Tax=Pseudonocardia acidicola TaxID=2724939 RepID=A0ABX1SKT6_9PSEU|nr:hypothetical protein [Pseudonocardia acidicola]NMI01119.1 hypothetical protein [Pseudonocardia acidicola]